MTSTAPVQGTGTWTRNRATWGRQACPQSSVLWPWSHRPLPEASFLEEPPLPSCSQPLEGKAAAHCPAQGAAWDRRRPGRLGLPAWGSPPSLPRAPILWVERKVALWAVQVSGARGWGAAPGGPCCPSPAQRLHSRPTPGHRGHHQLPGNHASHLPQLHRECPQVWPCPGDPLH